MEPRFTVVGTTHHPSRQCRPRRVMKSVIPRPLAFVQIHERCDDCPTSSAHECTFTAYLQIHSRRPFEGAWIRPGFSAILTDECRLTTDREHVPGRRVNKGSELIGWQLTRFLV